MSVLHNHHAVMKSPLPHNSSDTPYADCTYKHNYYSGHSINVATHGHDSQEETESQSEVPRSMRTSGTQKGYVSNVKTPSAGICRTTCSDGKWNCPNEVSPAPDINYDDTQFDDLRSEPQLLANLCY